ncbi:YcgJ family protein [Enterobacteriaceae bacterium LUAb1]
MMNKFILTLILSLGCVIPGANAASKDKLTSPHSGVVCDSYFCANAEGISNSLTEKYLGKKKEQQLARQGDFDHTAFTFSNGIFCDTKEKLCRKDRYYGEDGKHSGIIDQYTTHLLFDDVQ